MRATIVAAAVAGCRMRRLGFGAAFATKPRGDIDATIRFHFPA
jgi:hypothetical protein